MAALSPDRRPFRAPINFSGVVMDGVADHPFWLGPYVSRDQGHLRAAMDMLGTTRIKWTYATHMVDHSVAVGIEPITGERDMGAVVLGRVVTIGKHKEVEDVNGRRMTLFPGDVIAGVLGDRYATDQYEGVAVAAGATGHLLGQGGV